MGGFIFDDLINLSNLSVFFRFEGMDAFIRYILSYEAGPLKRPISTLSFLLNTSSWPAQAYYFKLTNLLIHFINGLLLYLVNKSLIKQFYPKLTGANLIAIIGMAIWLLHPFFVSTTLYVVQRMSMLPATFILLGFLFYLKAIVTIKTQKYRARVQLIFAVFICTLLAVLSKENGVLLPIQLLLLNYILGINKESAVLDKKEKWFFLIIPSLVIIITFIYKIPHFIEGYDIREFSLIERLLTQLNVLVTYLYHLFVPEYFTEGVFADGFIVSHSLTQPISTLYSLLFLIILLIVALILKKKFPLISFAILFYFIGHSIESSIIPLEMYFEHRNYLPAMFIFLPLAMFLVNITKYSKVYFILIIAIFAILLFTTYLRSNLWSNNTKLFMQTADKFPLSIRATDRKTAVLYSNGHIEEAIFTMQNAQLIHDDISLRANIINLRCSMNKTTHDDFMGLVNYINITKITKEDRNSLIAILSLLSNNKCIKKPNEMGLEIINSIKVNLGYKNKKVRSIVGYFEGLFNYKLNRKEKSMSIFKEYVKTFYAYDDTIVAVKLYMKFGDHKLALELLGFMENVLTQRDSKYTVRDYYKEINKIREEIRNLND